MTENGVFPKTPGATTDAAEPRELIDQLAALIGQSDRTDCDAPQILAKLAHALAAAVRHRAALLRRNMFM